jgi:hypothetical protein
MATLSQTAPDTKVSSIVHPGHRIPNEVDEGLRYFEQEERVALARHDEIARLARPTEEERQAKANAYLSAGRTLGLDVDGFTTSLRDIRAKREERVSKMDPGVRASSRNLTPLDLEPIHPERIDHSFWWAQTDWFNPGDFSADFRADGLHFTRGITHHSGSLRIDRFGMVARFELQANRIPHSGIRRWRSTPHVELFGAILGKTGDNDITTGDLWSKCWMFRRQTLLQFGFGPTGPVPIVVGEGRDNQLLIFEENQARTVRAYMPGFQWMPPVDFGNINLASSLWVHLEVRFDVQVEGHGSLLWMDPEVLIRSFQWPLIPL